MQSIVQPTKMLEQIDFLSQNARYFWKCASECIGRMSFSHKAETLDQNGRSGGQDIIFLSHFTFSVTVQKNNVIHNVIYNSATPATNC